MTEFDEELHQRPTPTPDTQASQADERKQLMRALESLPLRSRQVLVLRELEGCSYQEIADIAGIPTWHSDVQLVSGSGALAAGPDRCRRKEAS